MFITVFHSITYFPFDVQSCGFMFLPENALAHQVYLYIIPGSSNQHLQSMEWDLLNVTNYSWVTPVEHFIEDRPVDYLSFGIACIHLARDPTYYVTTLLIPSTLLCLMALATFEAPPDSGERISLSVSMVLGLTVFQLLVANILPTSSKETPVLGRYLTANFIIACLTVPLSMMNIKIAYGDSRLWILKYAAARKFLLEIFPRIFCMPTFKQRLQGELVFVTPQPIFDRNVEVITLVAHDKEHKKNQVTPLPSPHWSSEKLSPTEKVRSNT